MEVDRIREPLKKVLFLATKGNAVLKPDTVLTIMLTLGKSTKFNTTY